MTSEDIKRKKNKLYCNTYYYKHREELLRKKKERYHEKLSKSQPLTLEYNFFNTYGKNS